MKQIAKDIQSYLIKTATKAVYNRGMELVNYCFLENIETSEGTANFLVSSQSSDNVYNVSILRFLKYPYISSCSCPYNAGIICKHEVAAFLCVIQKILAEKEEPEESEYPPLTEYRKGDKITLIQLKNLDDAYILHHSNREEWINKSFASKIKVDFIPNEAFKVSLVFNHEQVLLKFTKDFVSNFVTITSSCKCGNQAKICRHMLAAIIDIRGKYDFYALDLLRNLDQEKNEILKEYGFKASDDISNLFEFNILGGKLNLIKLDPSIRKLNQFENWRQQSMNFFADPTVRVLPSNVDADSRPERSWIIVLSTPDEFSKLADVKIRFFSAILSPKTGKYTYLKEFTGILDQDTPEFTEDIKTLQLAKKQLGRDFLIETTKKYTNSNFTFYSTLDYKAKRVINEIIGKTLDSTLEVLNKCHVCIIDTEANSYYTGISSYNNLVPINIATKTIRISFILREEDGYILLEAFANINGENVPVNELTFTNFVWFIEYNYTYYKWAGNRDQAIATDFIASGGMYKVRKNNFEEFFGEFVLPLSDNFDLDIQLDLKIENKALVFNENNIYIKEEEDSLLFIPAYQYSLDEEKHEFEYDGRLSKITYENGIVEVLARNANIEKENFDFIKSQHPAFENQENQGFFNLSHEQVLEKGWLFNFYENLKEHNINVFGQKDLKKFKYNINKAKFEIKASSGIDWFDMQLGLTFGDQTVSLKDIKNAVVKKQNYVQLGDGSLGILPDEWITQYANLFKLGKVKGENIQLSKFHFSLIDELTAEVDNEEIRLEIEEKKFKLANFKNIKDVALPHNITGELRDYQLEGYNWLNFLDEFGWGGCLADDMGLGKTVQILTFLQNQANIHNNPTNLVIVPTSLIFNWQAEVEKFCPNLKVLVNHGQQRVKDTKDFSKHDIVLTTYGTLRSDILLFKDYHFHYIILDESQAIKNGSSQVAKAVKLLKAKNKLVMTGTPVENNTFDLYSQFEFLNPGLLGSEEFFRTEFANAIDKNQDKEASAMLRKMIYPFMLKRTKEEVAKDLPDKTETTLFCEMGTKQRKVYETFRDKYRNQLVSKFSTEGKEKSGMLILEALMKLRQICDSPALLSEEGEFPQDSIKLDEITREIEENASNHKILVFSQFLKMLDLIRTHLDKQGISYEYLDGSTTDRASRVNRFQSDKKCRVFLISLKAGGVGLNLTEADYVYLVDPWWNPAVEAQAIDRTHRIGQTNKVFAYKMICKDTIEEKILLLQAKKKEIASDLVGAETGFIKKLSQDDILDLFS